MIKYLLIIIIILNIIGVIAYIMNKNNKYYQLELYNELRQQYINEIDKYNFDNDVYAKKLNNIPMYFINLPQSIERKNYIIKHIKEYNIPNATIYEAVYGKNRMKLQDENMYKIDMKTQQPILFYYNGNRNDGEIGCTLSHLNMILQAYNNNLEYVITCEDDIDMYWVKVWNISIKDIMSNAPKNWEYINLKNFNCKNNDNVKYIPYVKNTCFTTSSQIINRKGMKKILDKCYKNGVFLLDTNIYSNLTADGYIPGLLNSYAYYKTLFPSLNDISGMESTIHDHNSWHNQENAKSIKILYNDFMMDKRN